MLLFPCCRDAADAGRSFSVLIRGEVAPPSRSHFHHVFHSRPSLSGTSVFSAQSAGKDRAGDLEGDGDLIRHLSHEARGAIAGLQVLWLLTIMASVIHAVKEKKKEDE